MVKKKLIIETVLWAVTALFLIRRRRVLIEGALLVVGHLVFFKHFQKRHESES
ncbi:hypothetical protein NIE88_21500 [Sporolactobacillus shoreicorticis]|uniref:Uncharacterized protein n=1 Tax=Sporolactobacillus shoreicorticis TaxID=1923877 RepID=A0ABW5S1G8_9BACL|nr:hypothetical protein [Sporolactobacillus shoreicorticis]MCO7128306.1 hypothetical protein [Sporolactobacillus shoreicorticis]